MQRRDVLKQLSAVVALAGTGLPVFAQGAGKGFELVSPPQPTVDKNKVEVIEFFHYGCPHCKAFDPLLDLWIKKLPADVVFQSEAPQGSGVYATYHDEVLGSTTYYCTLEG